MTRKSSKHFRVTYGTRDSRFDLTRSQQQCIPWSLPLEMELANTETRAETLRLGYRSTSHTSDDKLTIHGKCTTTKPYVSWRYVLSLQRTRSLFGPRFPKSALCIYVGLTSWAENRFYIWKEELYYINWITMSRKSGKHFYAAYETLDSGFDLIRSQQQCISWSPPLEIKPATTETSAETLRLGNRSTSHTSDANNKVKAAVQCSGGDRVLCRDQKYFQDTLGRAFTMTS